MPERRRETARTSWLAACAGALLLTGCGGGEAAGTAASDCGLDVAGTGARSGPHPSELMFLTGVRAAAQECVDRVVFTFRPDASRPPGFRVAYQPASSALVEDGSGERIEVAGSAFLVVRLEPAATAESSDDQLVFTYTGPRRLAPAGTRFVREVVKTGDFEAAVTWVIGLSEERPFRVSISTSPRRLVVDVG